MRHASASEPQVGGAQGLTWGAPSRRRRQRHLPGPAHVATGIGKQALEREHPACHVYLVAGLAQHALAAGGRACGGAGSRGPLLAGPLGFEQLETDGRHHVAHRHASAIAAVELKAGDEASVPEALQPPLRGGGSARGVEATVDLTRQHMPEAGDEGQDLQV